MQNLAHKVLLVLTSITIIAEVASIVFWTVNPTIPLGQARSTLTIDYRIAVASAAVFAALNSLTLILIIRNNKNGPIFLMAISIINRIISDFFFIGGAHLVFITWTIVLIIFAILDYRNLTKQTRPSFLRKL